MNTKPLKDFTTGVLGLVAIFTGVYGLGWLTHAFGPWSGGHLLVFVDGLLAIVALAFAITFGSVAAIGIAMFGSILRGGGVE